MNGVKTPFVVNAYYKAGNDILDQRFDLFAHEVDDTTPRFTTFEFKNIKCMDVCYGVGFFMGLPESMIECVRLQNIDITYNKESDAGVMAMTSLNESFKGVGFVLRNIKKLELDNVRFIDEPLNMYIKDNNVKILIK